MDLLSDILSRMDLSGTLYFRTSFTAPWSIKVPSYKNVARFHLAHKGRCLIRVEGEEEPIVLEQGDLAIVTRGAAHTLYCTPETENQAVVLDEVLEKSGFTGKGTLVYGEYGTNHETQLVCGHFAFSDDAQHLFLNALPSHIQIKDYGSQSGVWMENTLKVIGNEAGRGDMGSDLISLKLSEIIFTQALRAHLETNSSNSPVLQGFSDLKISRALTAIHERPGFDWSLEKLADVAGMSRTAFAKRFSECMTMTPLNYITNWRMEIARQELTKTHAPIIEIAEMIGYKSEAAFSRVFKKHFDKAPATYRRSMSVTG